MNGKERIAIVMESVAKGNTGVEKGTELVVQIFGDVYDEGKAVVVASFNPPSVVLDPKKCYCGNCGEGFRAMRGKSISFVSDEVMEDFYKHTILGGEG
jgi:hypothetical protein